MQANNSEKVSGNHDRHLDTMVMSIIPFCYKIPRAYSAFNEMIERRE